MIQMIKPNFNDLNSNSKNYNFIKTVVSNKLINGMTKNTFVPEGNVTKLQAMHRGRQARKEIKEQEDQAVKIQAQFRGMKSRRDLDKKLKGIDEDEVNAATKIQAIQRGKNERKRVQEMKEEGDAAIKVQAIIRGRNTRKTLEEAKKGGGGDGSNGSEKANEQRPEAEPEKQPEPRS